MLNRSARTIKIELGLSIWLASYLLVVHIGALLLTIFLKLDVYLLVAMTSTILISLICHWRRYLLLREPDSVIGIDWSADSGWFIRTRGNDRIGVRLCPSSFVSRYIVVLHFKENRGSRRRVAIACDAVDSDRFRRLRAILKTEHHFGM